MSHPGSCCWGKHPFPSYHLALAVSRRMVRRGRRRKGARISVYRCLFCGGSWHLGRVVRRADG